MLLATCHCGAVKIEVPARPETLCDCNCSICRRLGALWAYYKVDEVRVSGHPEHTDAYVWGEKTLRTLRCRTCGCATHWEPLELKADSKLGVNARNMDPAEIAAARIRRFDGADSWTYLD